MLLLTDLNTVPSLDHTCGLTIGSFDGVHLGHQMLLKHLRAKLPSKGLVCVFTFSNHPSHLFTPQSPLPLICPPLQKMKLLETYGVDIAFLIPFTAEFAQISYEEFLKQMHQRLNFSHLALGAGATFGKNREGNEMNVKQLAQKRGFEVDYLPKFLVNGVPVSSRRIRTLISEGKFLETKECLGRPYSLTGSLHREKNHHSLHLPGICLPPKGAYPVHVKTSSQSFETKGHVSDQSIILDIPKSRLLLAGENAEVIFDPISLSSKKY